MLQSSSQFSSTELVLQQSLSNRPMIALSCRTATVAAGALSSNPISAFWTTAAEAASSCSISRPCRVRGTTVAQRDSHPILEDDAAIFLRVYYLCDLLAGDDRRSGCPRPLHMFNRPTAPVSCRPCDDAPIGFLLALLPLPSRLLRATVPWGDGKQGFRARPPPLAAAAGRGYAEAAPYASR